MDSYQIGRFCRAFNSGHFGKKVFLKSCYFRGDRFKILCSEKQRKRSKYRFFTKLFFIGFPQWFLSLYSIKTRSKTKSKTIFGFLVKRRIKPCQTWFKFRKKIQLSTAHRPENDTQHCCVQDYSRKPNFTIWWHSVFYRASLALQSW